ncbi:MAG TPA: LytTR family DNA-binding domain-containing protein [Steroidobacteraceae bacterium]|nr:LytTR family DNA-binding domain-containing protein [Steroidobacteraceae bacterium]
MKVTAIIAEDEAPLARDLQMRLTKAWPELEIVAIANNGLDALDRIEELRPTIAFLDINMPGLTGLQVAQQLEHKPHIVFVTAYSEHAVEAFEREAVDYLLKPVQDERLQQAVERLKSRVGKQEPAANLESLLSGLLGKMPNQERYLKWIRAGVGNTIHNIAVEDVLYFEAEDKYTRVITKQFESLVRIAISELEAQLDPQVFQRVHRGTIVNLRAIKSIHKNELGALELVIEGRKETVAVSRAHASAFRQM